MRVFIPGPQLRMTGNGSHVERPGMVTWASLRGKWASKTAREPGRSGGPTDLTLD